MSFLSNDRLHHAESPNLDQQISRLSTPVSELDDHRGHRDTMDSRPETRSPEASPVIRPGLTAEEIETERTSTSNSMADRQVNHTHCLGSGGSNTIQTNIPPSQLLSPTQAEFVTSPMSLNARQGSSGSADHTAPIARDFESAIFDDGKSADEPFPSVIEDGDVTPNRRYSRRTKPKQDRSRDSSTASSRSTSPPTSIHAFAEGRARVRANTFGSVASELDLQLQRTASGGTHKRRPTFSSHTNYPGQVIDDSDAQVDEEKREEESKPSKIDYEVLHEFATEQELKRGRQQRRASYVSDQVPTQDSNGLAIPQITKQSASPTRDEKEEREVGSIHGSIVEKVETRTPYDRRPSFVEPRFAFLSSKLETTAFVSELGNLIMDGETFRDLFELPNPEQGAWWLDVLNPTLEEMEMFEDAFDIHPLTKDDIIERETREKVELFNNYYFVNFKTFDNDKDSEDYLEGINIYMIVFREGVLTFSYAKTPHAAGVRKKISKLKKWDDLISDWICYALVDNIVDFFFPVMRDIENETEQIEDQVFTARDTDFSDLLRQIGFCRKRVMSLMRLLTGKADVIKGFAKRCNTQYSVTPRGDIGLYLSDIQDHIVTMSNNLGHFEKMLSRSHSNYLAQLSVDNLVQGNRANDNLNKITVIATILVPMNLVCGLFGMNVPVPGNPDGGSLAWFGGIIGFLGFIVLSSLLLAKYLRYI